MTANIQNHGFYVIKVTAKTDRYVMTLVDASAGYFFENTYYFTSIGIYEKAIINMALTAIDHGSYISVSGSYDDSTSGYKLLNITEIILVKE